LGRCPAAALVHETALRCGAGWKGLSGNYLSELEAQPGGPSGRSLTTAGSKPIDEVDRPRGERPFPTRRVIAPAPLTSSRTRCEKQNTTPVPPASACSHTLYDGRGFLRSAGDATTAGTVTPTYDSSGVLHSLLREPVGDPTRRYILFYLAGRPVAQLATESGQPDRWWYLTTDHLGTPLVATDAAQATLWNNHFEPFGTDPWAGTNLGALENEMVLRFPGQWEDPVWQDAMLGAEGYYNVWRWYEAGTGRFSRPDPLEASPNDYSFVDARPTRLVDSLGLLALDPDSCGPFQGQHFHDDPARCCHKELERAVQKYNEFFARGWRRRNPDCWNAIDGARFRSGWKQPLGNQGNLTPLSCMVAGHHGETMNCDFKFRRGGIGRGGCGWTDPATGQTSFRPQICSRGACPSPLNVIFHERLHRCGAPPEMMGLFTDAATIARTCVGP